MGMIEVVKNQETSKSKCEKFNSCSCSESTGADGCFYVEQLFHRNDIKSLADAISSFEIYDVFSWEDLKKFQIDIGIQDHFMFRRKDLVRREAYIYSAIPVLVCKKVDDEFDHFEQLNQLHEPYGDLIFENDENHPVDKFAISRGFGILNTSDSNTKIVVKCAVYYER